MRQNAMNHKIYCSCIFLNVVLSGIMATSCDPLSNPVTGSWTKNETADSSEIGFRFYSYSFRSPAGYDVHQCALYCEQDPRCKSFNYLSVEKICELNNEDRNSVEVREYVQIGQNWLESVNGLVAYEGSQYFSRNAYALKSKESLDGCSSSPCPHNHVCSSGGSGSYQCQKTEFTEDDFLKQWGNWEAWSDCTVSCGTGTQERKRECEIPEDFWLCKGRSSERRLCNEVGCPIWAYWGPWSDCDLPDGCGFGTRQRSRVCMNGVLSNDQSCPGSNESELVCRTASCDTPVMLGSGIHGDAYIYDDTMLYEPVWRQVCESHSENSTLTVKLAICAGLGLDLADDDVTPTSIPNDDELVFQPVACGLDTRRLMRCVHNGWIKAKDCQKILAVKCTDSPEKGEVMRCNDDNNDVTIACSQGKEIRIDEAFYGREKGVTTCSSAAVSSNCFALGGLNVLEKACQHHAQCVLPASDTLFGGNPCPNSGKNYSKMKYSCVKYLFPFYAGMKDGSVKDTRISASSRYSQGYSARYGRLDGTRDGWLPTRSNTQPGTAWIQVHFYTPVHVLGAITQSRARHDQWTKKYKVAYGNSSDELIVIKNKHGSDKIFLGNTQRNTYSVSLFEKPVYGTIARLIVEEAHRYVAIRMEWLVAY